MMFRKIIQEELEIESMILATKSGTPDHWSDRNRDGMDHER